MLNPESFSDREDFSLGHQQVLGNIEPLFRFSNPETSVKSILEGHRDHTLAEARSELMKQELQRQAHSQRLELDDANCGYEESRREQVRLREGLALSRYAHEMGELRRAQEMRVDEFSLQKLRESHAAIQELTSQIQDLQERLNCVNDSREFQAIDLI